MAELDQNAELFGKYDASSDYVFYQLPRKVVHIDDGAIKAVTQVYRELLPAGNAVLDLMSAWRSHLPQDVKFSRVAGLGMNADELRDNPQLSDTTVHSLNDNPTLPYTDGEFDAAVCCVSVQYLQRPFEVFAEVRRVLKPGAPFILTFSNRCFPTKAVNVWHQTDDAGHLDLVSQYFALSGDGLWRNITAQDRSSKRSDPLYAVWAFAA